MTSSKIHYALDKVQTLCGRKIAILVNLTSDPRRITCVQCKSSQHLDGAPGSMTHTGH